MKTRLFVSAILALSLSLFSSCDTNEEDTGGTSNYWTSNALTQMQLKGSVHTMTTNDGEETVYTFNSDGNLTSKVVTGTSYSNTSTYTYENGRMISETNTSSQGLNVQKRSTTTTTYEYGNTGMFVPRGPYHLFAMGLTPALSAVINENSRMDYVFHGSDLWIVSSYENEVMDTTIFHFTGAYPTSCTTDYEYINNITYAENGMFLTYSEGFSGPGYDDNRTYTFVPNAPCILIDNMVNTNVYGSNTNVETTNYTYNDKFLMTEQSTENWASQWLDYVYDSAGNWTSRKYRYLNQEVWSEPTTETRSFTYY